MRFFFHHQLKLTHLVNCDLYPTLKTGDCLINMMLKTTLGLLALTAPLVSAVGKARVINKCDFEATLWSVDSDIDGPHHLNPKGGSYAEEFHRDPSTGGIAIKITREPDGLYAGDPQLVFAYNLDGSRVWYDLSSVFGNAFPGKKLVEKSAEGSCPAIVWPQGSPPGGSQVKVCTASKDVTLTLCA